MTAASNSEARKRATKHVPLAVLIVDEMPFVKCSCTDESKPQSAVWLREHWQGSEESGIEALQAVVVQQRAQATQTPVSQPIPTPVDSGAIGRLNEAERAELDERVEADLWGYYLHFEPTGVPEVDRILSAVGLAAKAYHHTENWNDDLDWDYGPIAKGGTCADFIQRAASDAAALVREHTDRALAEALADIRTRRQVFNRLGAHEQYLMALDDAFGLVNNRLAIVRAARQGQGR